MSTTLPDELLDTIQRQIALRQTQIQQLSIFYNQQYPTPQLLVAHGPEDVCIVETVQDVLKRQKIEHVTINCRECLSQRHLLTKIYARCVKALQKEDQADRYDRLDSINALGSNLKKLLQGRQDKLVLIITNADQQRGASPTLFSALARLGDIIPCLSLILTTSSPRPLALHRSGVPYIHFPPYNRTEAIQILLRDPPLLLPSSRPTYYPTDKDEYIKAIYDQFATIIYDTLIAPTTNSISKYREVCERLWPRFIWPVISNERVPGGTKSTDWDFARLVSKNRILFQSEGEEALQERLIRTSPYPITFNELIAHKEQQESNPTTSNTNTTSNNPTSTSHRLFQPVQPPTTTTTTTTTSTPPLLTYLPTLLLLSSYLASHTHPKHDIVLFSRLSTASSTNRRKKKYLSRSRAGGISKTTPSKSPSKKAPDSDNDDNDNNDIDLTTPSKTGTGKRKLTALELGTAGSTAGTGTPKKERADRSMRAIFEKTSSIARPFGLERVIAILRAIHPDGVGRGVADRVYAELGDLERLRLVVRVESRGGKGAAEDVMEERWRCAVGREIVVALGRRWGVGIEGWEVE